MWYVIGRKSLFILQKVCFLTVMMTELVYASSGITYHGRILKPDSSPVTSATTQFRIQIRSPGTENCLLWEEQQTKDLSSTNGVFTVTINDTSEPSLIANTLPFQIERVFSNRTGFTGLSCGSGTTYTPSSSTEVRSMTVFFRENPTDTWEQMPITKVNYVPLALNSVQLEGYQSNEFLKIDPLSSYTTLTAANVNTLMDIIAGTSNLYLKPGTSFSGDVTGTYNSTVVERIRGTNVVATAPTTGQVLKYNGTNWAPAADDAGTSPGDASYTVKGLVQINADQATSGLLIASGVLAMPNVITAAGPFGSASSIPIITYDEKGRLTAVTAATVDDTTKLPLAGGTMTGNLNMGAQQLTNASSVSANDFSGRNFYHYNLANSQYANIKAPDALGLNYTLTLPTTAPVAGNVLSTDASGNLSWTPASSGSVTSVTGTAPIVSSGGATPAISLDTGNGLTISSNNLVVDAGLLANKIPQVGGAALGANGVVIANGTATALTSLNCALDQVIKFDASGFANCGSDVGSATGFVQDGNSFSAAATLGTNDNNDLNFETNGTTKMTILANGNVGIGNSAPVGNLDVRANSLSVVVAGGHGTGNYGAFIAASARGSVASPTASQSGDILGVFGALGYGTSGFPAYSRANMSISAAETWTNSAQGTNLYFATTPIGSTAMADRVTVLSSGNVGIGTTTPNSKLEVSGAIATTTNTVASGGGVDLSLSNIHVLNSVGGSTIALSNPSSGASYTIIVRDTAVRTYSFTGCSTKFSPANAATDASSETIYGLTTVNISGTWYCYITWTSGFQ